MVNDVKTKEEMIKMINSNFFSDECTIRIPKFSKILDVTLPYGNAVNIIFESDNMYDSKEVKLLIKENFNFVNVPLGYKYLKSIVEYNALLSMNGPNDMRINCVPKVFYILYDDTCIEETRDRKIEEIVA